LGCVVYWEIRKLWLLAQGNRSCGGNQLKILALEADAPGADEGAYTTALLQAEARRAWELSQAGVIRELYFRTDRHAAVLVLECASTEEAHDVLTTLPLVAAGLITFDLIPLAPYPGFARLFTEP
jgi:muconolactone delta-isomerase